MLPSLDATNFRSAIPWRDIHFQDILAMVTRCYEMMIADKVILHNDENEIRDVLLKQYLRNNNIRNLVGFIDKGINFEREVPEDISVGRVDIKITTPNTTIQQEAYYIIECKRLDSKASTGVSGLNQKYIDNGINRFTSSYYSTHYRVNAMIGFVVEKLDIHSNTDKLNKLLLSVPSINTTKRITKDNFIENFEYQYHSQHINNSSDELKIYHLMYDFADNIQSIVP